ncbi:MAG TPA: SlyX protein [Methylococcaceae bacterium]|nr:SlyX protein [Methylococcaceae bacterium]
MTEERLIELEIKVSYQDDLLQTLNTIIATQQRQIDCLEHAYKTMAERVNSLANKTAEDTAPTYEIPPHY